MTPLRPADSFERIRLWLGDRCGIHYPDHKRDTLLQRLERLLRTHGCESLETLAAQILTHDNYDLQLAAIQAAATNHTYFFREPEVLDQVRREVLPQFAQRSELRFWSAACSSGDEAYTLAMLVAETLGMEALNRLTILGTDISDSMIRIAESGVFPNRQVDPTPPLLLTRYFRPHDSQSVSVAPDLRRVCTFRRFNLIQRPYPMSRGFQIVFLRNVLYYFDREDQIRTLEAVWDVTEAGGYLVTSVTEAVRDLTPLWTPVCPGISRKAVV